MRGIRRKIILNTTIITVILAIITSIVLSVTSNLLVDDAMIETLAPFAKTASKSVESNLHLLSDRIVLISQNELFQDKDADKAEIQNVLDYAASGIEFTWLAIYNANGTLIYGNKNSPNTIADREMYSLMNDTQNVVIGDTESSDNGLEVAVGKPIISDGSIVYYLVGSYKYDVLNDVISNIQIGNDYSAMIVNKEGVVVAHSDSSVAQQHISVSELFKNDAQMITLMKQINAGLTGSTIAKINRADTVVAYSPVNGANWSLVITVPKSEFMVTATSAIQINAVILLLLLAASLFITIRFSGRVAKSLGNVTDRIKKLADGDLSSSVDILHTNDETETLSISLKNSISDINGYVYKLTHALEQLSNGNADLFVEGNFSGDFIVMKDALNNIITYLNDILSYLKQTSRDLSHSTRNVADNAIMVKNATENQFEAIRRLEEETGEISMGAATIDENALNTRNLMKTASEQLDCGKEQMNNTLQAMEDIRMNANGITSITKLMEDIAFQTNILALNAAVEAARAGAAGAGFAVVADEVRSLASQSAESAKQTAAMIEQTQKSIKSGADYALKTSEIIEQVTSISRNISTIADSLAYSAQSTHEALGKVEKDITSISTFAQDNLKSSSALAMESEEMAHKAEDLYEMSSKFKLREGTNEGYLND